jgi:hypothetical protein
VLGSPGLRTGLLLELLGSYAANGANMRSGITGVNITTNRANKLFHNNYLQNFNS